MRAIYLLLCLLFSQITWANERDLMLLDTYENQDVQGWVMSEKLTKKRLIQIIIMLIILVSAFVWRYLL